MSKYASIRARWRWSANTAFRPLEASLNAAIRGADALASRRAEVEQAGTFSPKGLTQAMRDFAAAQVVPDFRAAAGEIAKAKVALKERRANLTAPKPDPTDAAGAVLRAEARTFLRGMPDGERIAFVMEDPPELILQAVFEVPAVMSGLPADVLARVEEQVLEHRHGEELERIEEQEEAAEVAQAALTMALDDLRHLANFDKGLDFDAFMRSLDEPINPAVAGPEEPAAFASGPREARTDAGDMLAEALASTPVYEFKGGELVETGTYGSFLESTANRGAA